MFRQVCRRRQTLRLQRQVPFARGRLRRLRGTRWPAGHVQKRHEPVERPPEKMLFQKQRYLQDRFEAVPGQRRFQVGRGRRGVSGHTVSDIDQEVARKVLQRAGAVDEKFVVA